ncbi:hypothetical protein [Rubritalea tangerina]|uniref:hypothetical protein n=1 Tax=Rubritalea tangerina TaxID=430798 RepID=UPI00362235E5
MGCIHFYRTGVERLLTKKKHPCRRVGRGCWRYGAQYGGWSAVAQPNWQDTSLAFATSEDEGDTCESEK